MCEVEGWVRAQHCMQHPRYRAGPQMHSWPPGLRQSCTRLLGAHVDLFCCRTVLMDNLCFWRRNGSQRSPKYSNFFQLFIQNTPCLTGQQTINTTVSVMLIGWCSCRKSKSCWWSIDCNRFLSFGCELTKIKKSSIQCFHAMTRGNSYFWKVHVSRKQSWQI